MDFLAVHGTKAMREMRYANSGDEEYEESMDRLVPTLVVKRLSYSPLDPRFSGSNPARVNGFFQSLNFLSMTSFGREVKPWVLCRRFMARKSTSNRN